IPTFVAASESAPPYLTVVAACASWARSRSVVLEPGVIGAFSRTLRARAFAWAGAYFCRLEADSLDRSPGFESTRLRSAASVRMRTSSDGLAGLAGLVGFLAT